MIANQNAEVIYGSGLFGDRMERKSISHRFDCSFQAGGVLSPNTEWFTIIRSAWGDLVHEELAHRTR